jgi:L-asparagine transporter-like permease
MTVEPTKESQRIGIRVTVITVVGVLLLFLVVLASGSPIRAFGTMGSSLTYSVIVFIPVIVVCAFAMRKTWH